MYNNISTKWGIKITQYVFILVFFFIHNTLYSYNEMKDTPDTLIFTEDNNGDSIQVVPGSIIILKLEAIPGTGYAWHVVKEKPNLLSLMEEPIFEPKNDESTARPLGAVAYNVFRYCAKKEGTEILELGYMRVWEKNKPPLKIFSITIHIKK